MAELWISGIILIVLFYFFLILPQQLSNRKHRKELKLLNVGDNVVTIGGIIGAIVALDADQAVLEIAPKVNVKILRSAISHKLQADMDRKTAEQVSGSSSEEHLGQRT